MMTTTTQLILIDFEHATATPTPTYATETAFIVFAIIISLILFLLIFFTIRFSLDHSNRISALEKSCKNENGLTADSLDEIIKQLNDLKESSK